MFGVSLVELIIIIVIIGLIVAAVGLFFLVYWVVEKKTDAPSDDGEQKEKRRRRIVLTCAGCSAGCLVILAVLAVLASIALPALLHSRIESKRSEARTILAGIYEAEAAFYWSQNRYSADPDEIGFMPASEPHYYRWEITYADDTRFEAYAWGNIDEDPVVDTWKVTEQSRVPINTVDDLSP